MTNAAKRRAANGGKRPGGERGNSYSRRARRARICTKYGDGLACACVHCGTTLRRDGVFGADRLELDRIVPGAGYNDENVQPACRACNLARSDNPDWQYAVGVAA